MTATQATKDQIIVKPWDYSDNPIGWLWIDEYWEKLADDFFPRDMEAYFDIRNRQGAVSFGVWRNDELGGLISLIPRLPITYEGHSIFKRSFQRRQVTIPAFEKTLQFAWAMGIKKISCQAFTDNHAMIRLLEAIGAVREGVLVAETQRFGEPADLISYAILKP